jgi:DNA polymerase-4
MSERAILHVDMDAFFAAVEVLDNPALRGRPVIVGGTPAGRGVVAAASYEARRFGVHSAMSAARAVKLCPNGVFLPPRHERYAAVSEQVFAVFRRYSPLVEPLSIDEAFLDVTGSQRLFGPAAQIGRAIKRCIQDEIGLTASVGVAPNKFLAKLGSELDKPDGFFVFTLENCRGILQDLPICRLWGVGQATERRLRRLGIEKVGDLPHASRRELDAILGRQADHLLALARGQDDRAVIPSHTARSIGHEVTFAEDIGDIDRLRNVLDELAAKVAHRLRRHGLVARTVQVKARFPDFTTLTRAATLREPTGSTADIRRTARELLDRRLSRQGRALRLLGVSARHLEPSPASPTELFVDPRAAREREIDTVLDRVHAKYGDKIRRGAGRKSRGVKP